jgi:hypothetical protein
MNINTVLEDIAPGHFSKRELTLKRLKSEWEAIGFFPQEVSHSDIECYWLRFETKDGKYYSTDVWSPNRTDEYTINFMKEHLRYEGI